MFSRRKLHNKKIIHQSQCPKQPLESLKTDILQYSNENNILIKYMKDLHTKNHGNKLMSFNKSHYRGETNHEHKTKDKGKGIWNETKSIWPKSVNHSLDYREEWKVEAQKTPAFQLDWDCADEHTYCLLYQLKY